MCVTALQTCASLHLRPPLAFSAGCRRSRGIVYSCRCPAFKQPMPEDSPQPRQSPTMLRRGSSKGVSPLRELRRIDTPPRLSKQGGNARNMGACLAGAALMVVAYVLLQRPLAVPKAETAVAAPRSLAHRHKALNILYVVLEDFGVLGTSLFSSPGGAPPGSTPPCLSFHRVHSTPPLPCRP